MKKLALTLSVVGIAFGLSACGATGMGNVETAVPYTTDRTASHGKTVAAMTDKVMMDNGSSDADAAVTQERVFRQYQSK